MSSEDKKPTLNIVQRPGESDEAMLARTMLDPTVLAGISVLRLLNNQLNLGEAESDLSSLVEELGNQVAAANTGNVDPSVTMLISQAHTLNGIFHSTLQKACNNFGHYPETVERYMKLALKAQSQCRSTLQAISKIKNPTIIGYARQANIAHGHQQVNNILVEKNLENELLEENSGERLDFGATETAIGNDPEMETVGAVNGSENK